MALRLFICAQYGYRLIGEIRNTLVVKSVYPRARGHGVLTLQISKGNGTHDVLFKYLTIILFF